MERADRQQPTAASQSLSRRAFVAGSAGTAATAVLPGSGVAQTDREPVFTDVAISSTVPTLDRDDYTGLFVQVVRVEAESDIDIGVEACGFLESSGETVAYETRFIDRIEEDRTSTSAIVYADEGNDDVHEGKLFVVNTQEACSEDFVSLNLEQIGATEIGEVAPEGNGGTETTTPGFGVGTALLGLGGASLVALRRLVE
ncbi:PGF-CTERM sorting domain-containing protein [Halohasta litorea]|uniref:PGF-CTERM sorting domain-containing protein n=1 Tax=Halohasta litorea TaxID=869891 RepID=A0ABD6D3E2_9EURY|nr:PGF-CTERM sorting domain-containing protein [Halohasta litorea]